VSSDNSNTTLRLNSSLAMRLLCEKRARRVSKQQQCSITLPNTNHHTNINHHQTRTTKHHWSPPLVTTSTTHTHSSHKAAQRHFTHHHQPSLPPSPPPPTTHLQPTTIMPTRQRNNALCHTAFEVQLRRLPTKPCVVAVLLQAFHVNLLGPLALTCLQHTIGNEQARVNDWLWPHGSHAQSTVAEPQSCVVLRTTTKSSTHPHVPTPSTDKPTTTHNHLPPHAHAHTHTRGPTHHPQPLCAGGPPTHLHDRVGMTPCLVAWAGIASLQLMASPCLRTSPSVCTRPLHSLAFSPLLSHAGRMPTVALVAVATRRRVDRRQHSTSDKLVDCTALGQIFLALVSKLKFSQLSCS
jgi:hypothetical protein